MGYSSYNQNTYDASLKALQNEKNWRALKQSFGEQISATDIDKSWDVLSNLFESSEVGDFILGNKSNSFDINESLFCCFSNEYLKTVCDYIEAKDLTNRDVFIVLGSQNDAFPENDGDYYYLNFVDLYNFYCQAVNSGCWVLGELE